MIRMGVVTLVLFVGLLSPVFGDTKNEEMIGAFLKHVGESEYPVKAKSFLSAEWADRKGEADPEEFLLEALAVLSSEFSAGLDAYDEESYAESLAVMDGLCGASDPFFAANSQVYAIKSLVELDRLEEAGDRIEALLKDPAGLDLNTPYASEVAFLRGYVALQNVDYDHARSYLRSMVARHPDAPRRLLDAARQMLAELDAREPERIGDVADLMNYAGRRLSHRRTDEGVQTKQQRAIELLDQLIEEAEQNEQSGGGGGGSGGGQDSQPPSAPMPDSQLPGGQSSEGQNLRNARRVRPGEAWGSMPPAERKKILQSLRDSFPSRYRQLVEQYYQDLAKKP
jgi:tetratricopeptide (TPR) repeat protein